jgi:phosphoglycolate phosphatase
LFDLDGTLVDSLPDLAGSLNRLRAELDLPPLPRQQVAVMVGDGATMLVKRALGPQRFQMEHLHRFMRIYAAHLADETCCYAGIEELLNRHDPTRMAVITNKPYILSVQLLEALDLLRFFKIVIGGDSFPEKKPHPLPVEKALNALSAKPEKAVMIGDHHTDIVSGQSAGTAVCFCAYGLGHNNGLKTTYQVKHPQELNKLFPGPAHD